MPGIVELNKLLKAMTPEVQDGEYVFCTVEGRCTDYGISTNVVAAYYHDHIFVQADRADEALPALKELSATEN